MSLTKLNVKRLMSLASIFVCILASQIATIASADSSQDQDAKPDAIDQMFSEPKFVPLMEKYNKAHPKQSFKEAFVNFTNFSRSVEHNKDDYPQLLISFSIMDDTVGELLLPRVHEICKEQPANCWWEKNIRAMIKNRRECNKNHSGESCLKVATLYKAGKYLVTAQNFAQTACMYQSKGGCEMYKIWSPEVAGLNAEPSLEEQQQKKEEAVRAERDAAEQQRIARANYAARQRNEAVRAALVEQAQAQRDASWVAPLQALGNSFNQPAVQKTKLNCSSQSRRLYNGEVITDTDCN